ncbi:hypothetical protein L198_08159 [Cryptococcus wingfieldii CBS 7118]|uniref:DDE Tnp4 domain-containing protein n=1 Tax=Cryptococcus wingfieldii CBS 7118 TaxID=1295528 RepID=A0A1E3HH13_9TREE|nr:hypothetical protein L198_08159 [Cryptococcus wingfieldii CBS 7118]ODN75629.1 hypothetical protein L198_08159 [Cryptococcus wingfieldii CBS 7118]
MIPTTSRNSPGSPLHEQTSYGVKRKYHDSPPPQPKRSRKTPDTHLPTPPNSSPSRPLSPQPDKPLLPLPLEILNSIIGLADSGTLRTIAGVSKTFRSESRRVRKRQLSAVTGGVKATNTSNSRADLRCPMDRQFGADEHIEFSVYDAECRISANPSEVMTTGKSEFGVMSSVLGEGRSKAPFKVEGQLGIYKLSWNGKSYWATRALNQEEDDAFGSQLLQLGFLGRLGALFKLFREEVKSEIVITVSYCFVIREDLPQALSPSGKAKVESDPLVRAAKVKEEEARRVALSKYATVKEALSVATGSANNDDEPREGARIMYTTFSEQTANDNPSLLAPPSWPLHPGPFILAPSSWPSPSWPFPPGRKLDRFLSGHLDGAVGALDGTHIVVNVDERDRPRYRNRLGRLTMNVLAACTFDMLFTHVFVGYEGYEGSANDQVVLSASLEKGFAIPEGRYYLADAGMGLTPGFSFPFTACEGGDKDSPFDQSKVPFVTAEILPTGNQRTFLALGRVAMLRGLANTFTPTLAPSLSPLPIPT